MVFEIAVCEGSFLRYKLDADAVLNFDRRKRTRKSMMLVENKGRESFTEQLHKGQEEDQRQRKLTVGKKN